MSFTRSPIRRREEHADAQRTTSFIATILALAAFAYIGWLAFLVQK